MKKKTECPKNCKTCNPAICFSTVKNNYICCGINKKPTKYKYDIINLCLKGIYSSIEIEMTKEEALHVMAVLNMGLITTQDKI